MDVLTDSPEQIGRHVAQHMRQDTGIDNVELHITYDDLSKVVETDSKGFRSIVGWNYGEPRVLTCRAPTDIEREEFLTSLLAEMDTIAYNKRKRNEKVVGEVLA